MECSGSDSIALDWGSKGCWFMLHRRRSHWVVSLSKTLYPLLSTGSTQEDPYLHYWKIVYFDIKNQTKWNILAWSSTLEIFIEFSLPDVIQNLDMELPTWTIEFKSLSKNVKVWYLYKCELKSSTCILLNLMIPFIMLDFDQNGKYCTYRTYIFCCKGILPLACPCLCQELS